MAHRDDVREDTNRRVGSPIIGITVKAKFLISSFRLRGLVWFWVFWVKPHAGVAITHGRVSNSVTREEEEEEEESNSKKLFVNGDSWWGFDGDGVVFSGEPVSYTEKRKRGFQMKKGSTFSQN